MSGHSKWSTIKRKKGLVDAKRGKLFTKAANEIIVASRIGGGDQSTNSRLRMAIEKAKEVNMPSDNIKRAIQRGTGEIEGAIIEEIMYEAYVQSGVAVVVECTTDNKNRTLPEIKNIFSKGGGNMAEKGAVSYMFKKRGVIIFDASLYDEDAVMEIALDYDVEDIKTNDDNTIEAITKIENYEKLKDAFDQKKMKSLNSEITMIADVLIPISNFDTAQKIMSIIEKLEDNDDVQNVYHNADFSEEIYEKMEME